MVFFVRSLLVALNGVAQLREPHVTQQILDTLATSIVNVGRMHCHPRWAHAGVYNDPFGRLYWVREGAGWTRHHGQTFALRPGRLFVIPAHTPSWYGCPRAMDLCWIHYTAHVLHGCDLFAFLDGCYEIPVPDTAQMDALWMQVLQPPASPGDYLLHDGILRQLLGRCINHADPAMHERQARGLVQFQRVLAYIEERLPARMTLDELAGVANLQRAYFSAQFSRRMGESPMAYVIRRRVERAKSLLRDSDLTVDAVARAVGFCDAYYFSRCFKRLTQITPGQFRRRQLDGQP